MKILTKSTCEFCEHWKRLGVTMVCACDGGPNENIATGACWTCPRFEPATQRPSQTGVRS